MRGEIHTWSMPLHALLGFLLRYAIIAYAYKSGVKETTTLTSSLLRQQIVPQLTPTITTNLAFGEIKSSIILHRQHCINCSRIITNVVSSNNRKKCLVVRGGGAVVEEEEEEEYDDDENEELGDSNQETEYSLESNEGEATMESNDDERKEFNGKYDENEDETEAEIEHDDKSVFSAEFYRNNKGGSRKSMQLPEIIINVTTNILHVVGQATMELCKSIYRAVDAAIHPPSTSFFSASHDRTNNNDKDETMDDEVEHDERDTVIIRILHTLQRMWNAMINISDEEKDNFYSAAQSNIHNSQQHLPFNRSHVEKNVSWSQRQLSNDEATPSTERSQNKQSAVAKKKLNFDDKEQNVLTPPTMHETDTSTFGSFLNTAYQGNYDSSDPNITSIMNGSLSDALRIARSQAKMVLVYIPSALPQTFNRATTETELSFDTICVRSLLHSNVKSDGIEYKSGSYLVWSARFGSPEAILATKQLRVVKPTKKTTPLLLVVYPANVFDKLGRQRLVPKVLGQHHCNPPPSSTSLVAWLRALRKRHVKQVHAMKHEVDEMQLFKERVEGYRSSVKGDTDREREDARLLTEKQAAKAEKIRRAEEILERRKELMESLPSEPEGTGPDVVVIALRFPDGRHGRRKFTQNTDIKCLFNWVDGEFGIEREIVTLATLNGKLSFTFADGEGKTLKEAGLPRMCGLRVIPHKEASPYQEMRE